MKGKTRFEQDPIIRAGRTINFFLPISYRAAFSSLASRKALGGADVCASLPFHLSFVSVSQSHYLFCFFNCLSGSTERGADRIFSIEHEQPASERGREVYYLYRHI